MFPSFIRINKSIKCLEDQKVVLKFSFFRQQPVLEQPAHIRQNIDQLSKYGLMILTQVISGAP